MKKDTGTIGFLVSTTACMEMIAPTMLRDRPRALRGRQTRDQRNRLTAVTDEGSNAERFQTNPVCDPVTMIRAVRLCSLVASISYTRDFRLPQKKKYKRLRSGKLGGQASGPPRSIHLPGYVAWRWLRTTTEKCAGAPSRMKPAFCYSKALSDGPRNFEPCSSDEADT
ncbi:hypothetical protein TNCV_991791 [Trichonephila clavipes]|nr:hypothetical protein TNCV_991791 [Trichonephila clavipes]